MNYLVRLFKEEEGQALTEYGLLIGLIAIAVIATLTLLGPKLNTLFEEILESLPTVGTGTGG